MDIIFLEVLFGIVMLLLVGTVIWLIYNIIIDIYIAICHKTLRYETFPSTAKVCNKEYKDRYRYTTLMPAGKAMIPITHYHPEEYNVYLMYDGERYCFDDEELYNSVNIENIVHVLVHKGYNKKDELKHVYLSIEE